MSSHRWRSELLGEPSQIETQVGEIEYFERGEGPALIFSHGWLSNANLWRGIVKRLHSGFRCICLDLPLGSHRVGMSEDARLDPDAVAGLIAEVVRTLELDGATLVGNDSGGAYSQIALSRHADALQGRVSGLVLTSCETPYDEWPPPPFDGLPAAAEDPEALGLLLRALEDPEIREAPAAFGLLMKRPSEASDSYALPVSRDREILRDVAKVMSSASTAPVREAGERLIARRDPLRTLLIWSIEDKVFPIEHARRFAAALGDADLIEIDDSYSFTPEDRPDVVAEAISSFATQQR